MADLPEFVYLITVDTEWPVTAIADCHPSTADSVEDEVKRRRASRNVSHPDEVKVWKARLADVRQVDLMPTTTVRASLREREPREDVTT